MDLIDIIIDQKQIDSASLRLFIDHIETRLADEQEPGIENIEIKVVLQAPFQSHDALYEDLIDRTKDLVQKEDATAVALQKNQMIEQVIA